MGAGRAVTTANVLRVVKRRPGVTCEQVAETLLVTCSLAGALLRELRALGKVRSRGNTRGTRYYAR